MTNIATNKHKVFTPKVYSNWESLEIDVSKSQKTIEYFWKAIRNALEDIEKWNNSIDIHKSILLFLWELKKRSFNIDEVEVDSKEYFTLTRKSQKKLLIKKLKEQYPNKQERKQILANIINVQWYDLDMYDHLKSIWVDPLFVNLADLISHSGDIAMQELSGIFINEMDDEYQKLFLNILKISWVSESIIKRFESYILEYKWTKTIAKDDSTIKTTRSKSLLQIKTSERKWNSDFNPLIYDLDLTLWLKLFNFNRLKEIYKDLFYKIIVDLVEKFWWTKPSFNKLLYIQKNKFKILSKDTEKKENIFQFTIEWNIPDDFSNNDLKEIAKILNIDGSELNLTQELKPKPFNHPIKTSEWIQEYNWHFNNNWDEFLWESILIINNKRIKEKKIRLTLNIFNQDTYIYFLCQISHYIKNRVFIDRNQLYFNIYDSYNKEIYGSNESYDITFFDKQYRQLMEKLIIPLSNEWKELWIKAHNTLLAWIYWSWKSQFLLKILKDKNFIINSKEFNLNANVIYLDLQSFKALLASPIWWIRTKLDEIYQNTNIPILLVVEDIDTLINEKLSWQNDEIAQAMTVFFEWIWSIPINIIATANEPSKLSERLIRPNRIYEIIEFYLPTEDEKKRILNLHLIDNWIDLSDKIIKQLMLTRVFKEWTASHIAAFCNELNSKIKIENALWNKNYILSEKTILEIAEKINISCKDITETITRIKEWILNVTWNWKAMNNIWFIQEK